MVDLDTTNMMLGIMAAVSVLEALVLIGLGVGGFIVYRRVMTLINDLEERQIAPLTTKVNAILGDVRAVTSRVQTQATRVDNAIHGTLDRVDSTAADVKDAVRERVDQVIGVARGVRAVLASLFGRDMTQARV
jgi:pyrimidine operon attenuation protein/uracil phosphoribosyltransferase